MIRILFVCLGNICRSPMAEFVMKDFIKKRNLEGFFSVASAATSSEEIGNPVHPGTRKKLGEFGISVAGKQAVKLRNEDYNQYDYIVGMESRNITNMIKIFGGDPEGKAKRLLDYGTRPRDIADPWYTGDFDTTYEDVLEGCEALLDHICAQELDSKGEK